VNPVSKKALKILAAIALAGVIGFGAWVVWGNFTGARFRPGSEPLSSPSALIEWSLRSVSMNRPEKFRNAMTEEYWSVFGRYFERLRKGEVPVKQWEEAARDAGRASSLEELKVLSDEDMFKVWWRLKDRGEPGIAVPRFLTIDPERAESAVILEVFYDRRDEAASDNAYVLYIVDGQSDLFHARKVDGSWRADVPGELPAGI